MRGGQRPGAGRRPKIDERLALMADLAIRLRATRGASRRAVVALAAFGADDTVIAAALAIKESDVSEFFTTELKAGRAIASGNLIDFLWRKAATGNATAIRTLEKRIATMEQKP
jgi:hypothetical protein